MQEPYWYKSWPYLYRWARRRRTFPWTWISSRLTRSSASASRDSQNRTLTLEPRSKHINSQFILCHMQLSWNRNTRSSSRLNFLTNRDKKILLKADCAVFIFMLTDRAVVTPCVCTNLSVMSAELTQLTAEINESLTHSQLSCITRC